MPSAPRSFSRLPPLLRVVAILLLAAVPALRAQGGFRGFYGGTLSTGGRIGIYVTSANDLSVVVVDPLSGSFGASTTPKVNDTGAFTGAYAIATISGQVAPNGNVTGSVSVNNLTFTARRAPLDGATRAHEGYWQGWVFDPNNRLLAINLMVSADGQLFAFILDGTDVVDAGYGTIDARGIFSWRDASNRVSSGSVITTAGGLAWNGRYSKTGVGAYTFVVGRRTAANKLINLATRGQVGAGAGAMIAGIVVEGGAKTLLIRGIGPGLAQFGVEGTLADPVLTLFSGETVIATNDNWNNVAATTTVAEVRDTSARLGAFALPENSRDAVLLIRLEPGRYTARLSGAADGTGIGLVEVYEVQ